MDETKRVVGRAQEVMPGCDWIIDIYDLSVIWASERLLKISGFTNKELIGKSGIKLIRSAKSQMDLKREMVDRLSVGAGKQTYTLIFKNKDIVVTYAYKLFVFEGGRYTVAKMLVADGMRIAEDNG